MKAQVQRSNLETKSRNILFVPSTGGPRARDYLYSKLTRGTSNYLKQPVAALLWVQVRLSAYMRPDRTRALICIWYKKDLPRCTFLAYGARISRRDALSLNIVQRRDSASITVEVVHIL